MRKLVLLVCLILSVSGCRLPSLIATPSGTPAGAAAQYGASQGLTLTGRVELKAFGGYATQATVGEIATAATVSLIDQQSNVTVATSVTDSNGAFSLNFGSFFRPAANAIYYLEAVKGLGNNRAGVSVARLRTMISFRNNGWVSLTSATPGAGIIIARSTTAISTIASLRQTAGSPVNTGALIGSIAYGSLDANGYDSFANVNGGVDTTISQVDYSTVMGLVTDAIARDQDPLAVILYDTVNYTFQRLTSGFTVSGLNPSSGPIGTSVTVSGTNLDPVPANNTVRFNGVQATVTSANSTALTVTVPLGATSGPVSVQIGSLVLAGVSFTVTSSDGHNIFDPEGNLYVGSLQTNGIYRLSPNGTLSSFASGSLIAYPYGLTYATDSLYVASTNRSRVVRIDSAGTVSDFAVVSSVRYLAISAQGTLYAANTSAIYSLANPASPVTVASGFSNIQGIAFNEGILYVADAGTRTIRRVASDGTVSTFVSGLNNPTGLSFDTAGNLYVTSQTDNNILRFDPAGLQSQFAIVNQPQGLAFNANGTFYTTDQRSYSIIQVTLTGAVRTYAEGINDPVGLNIDSGGNFYFLNRGASSLARSPSTGYLSTLASGFSRPFDSARAPDGTIYTANYNSSSISRVNPDGSINLLASNIWYPVAIAYDPPRNTIGVLSASGYDAYTINLSTGTTTRYPNPIRGASKLVTDSSGNIYGAEGNRVFRVATGSVEVTPQVNTTAFSTGVRGLFRESDGNLLVTLPGANKVVRLNPSTGDTTDVITTGLNYPYGVAKDANGNIYVSNFYNNSTTGAGSASIVVYNGTSVRSIWDYDGTSGGPYYTGDMAIANGNLYIFNYGRSNVLQYNLSTGAKSVAIANGGAIGFSPYWYSALTVDSNGTLYAPYYKSGVGYRFATLSSAGVLAELANVVYSYQGVVWHEGKIYAPYGYEIRWQAATSPSSWTTYAAGYAYCQGMSFDANGHLLIPGQYSIVQTYTSGASTGRSIPFAILPNSPRGQIYDIAFHPTTGDLYACSYNYLYRVAPTGGTMTYLSYNWPMSSIAFDGNGTLFSLNGYQWSSGYNYIRRYNAATNNWSLVDIWCYQPRF